MAFAFYGAGTGWGATNESGRFGFSRLGPTSSKHYLDILPLGPGVIQVDGEGRTVAWISLRNSLNYSPASSLRKALSCLDRAAACPPHQPLLQ